jgi:hypothetical protein
MTDRRTIIPNDQFMLAEPVKHHCVAIVWDAPESGHIVGAAYLGEFDRPKLAGRTAVEMGYNLRHRDWLISMAAPHFGPSVTIDGTTYANPYRVNVWRATGGDND